MDAEEKLSSDRSKQEASQTINASKYLDKTAWARVPIYFALSKYTLPIFYQRPLISRNDFCVSPIQFYREHFPQTLLFFKIKKYRASVVRSLNSFRSPRENLDSC